MKKIERFIVYGVVIALFALAIPFDYKITTALYHPDNIIGKLFEIGGEIPAYLVATFGALLLAFFHPKPSREVHWTLTGFFGLASLGIAGYAGYHTQKLIARSFNAATGTAGKVVCIGLVALLVFAVALFFVLQVQKEQERAGFSLGLYLVVTIGISVLLMQGLKMAWLRPRYRTLVALSDAGEIADIEAFWLPFYKPQFFTAFAKYQLDGEYGFSQGGIAEAMSLLNITKWSREEFYSFPSGHTMNTIACLALVGLPAVFPCLQNKKRFPEIYRYCIYGLGAIVAFSRILRGAHNATDVLAGYLIGIVLFDLGWTFFYNRFLVSKVEQDRQIVPQSQC